MHKSQRFLLVVFAALMVVVFHVRSGEKPRMNEKTMGATGSPTKTILSINNFTSFYRADGQGNHTDADQSGGRFPRNGATCIFADGFLWGAKLYRDSAYSQRDASQFLRVGGQTYNQGTRQGAVIGFGATAMPTLPTDPRARIYRIRRNYFFLTESELRSEAAARYEIPVSEVWQVHIQEMRDQYALDWTTWPVDLGAPYIERNGIQGFQPPPPFGSAFTPDSLIAGRYDEPGVASIATAPPADQVIWTVYNDLDRSATLNLYHSEPIGLEGQFTAWAYKRNGALGDLHFKRLRLINKGGINVGGGTKGAFFIDSMFVSMWSDGDVGDSWDDLCGSDTLLSLGYVYNARAADAEYQKFGLAPAAAGYILLQGPLVPAPGDSGIFDFRRIRDKRNLPLTAFVHQPPGSYLEPPIIGSYEETRRWYRMLCGFRPDDSFIPERYFAFPPNIPPGPKIFTGDPITHTGFIDGLGTDYSLAEGDRRILLSSGPFRMAPGDTQEVVGALVGGLGHSYLQSIAELKSASRVAREVYNASFQTLPPSPEVRVEFPSPQSATLRVIANARGLNATAMSAVFRNPTDATVLTAQLYDDGTHGDSTVHDGIFSAVASIAPQREALHLDLNVTYANASPTAWHRLAENITTVGPVRVTSCSIVSDNLNSDGIANTGENIRYTIALTNSSNVDLTNVRIHALPGIAKSDVALPTLNAQTTLSLEYEPNDPATYFSFDIAPDLGSPIKVALFIQDDQGNQWHDSVSFPVRPLTFELHTSSARHLSGIGDGEISVSIVDLEAVRSHRYVMHIVDSINASRDKGILLKDSTDGRIVLNKHRLPDSLGHLVPVTDGFKIRLAGVSYVAGMKYGLSPNGVNPISWTRGDSLALEGYHGAIGWEDPAHYFGNSQTKAVAGTALRNVRIVFATANSDTSGNGVNSYGKWNRETTTDTNMSYAYRYLQNANLAPARPEFAQYIVNASAGFAYQDYKKGVPFSAWNVDVTPWQRLAVGFLENNVSGGLVDGKWWPPDQARAQENTNVAGPREWFFIFNSPYTGLTPDTALQKNILYNSLPVMWMGTVTRYLSEISRYHSGDEQFLIVAKHLLTSQDSWMFTLDSIASNFIPEQYVLEQNYPNPFNPVTTIRYQLPFASKVTIKVYNILGQEVATLLSEQQILGFHSVEWNSTNLSGSSVASGVYFYRIEATSLIQPSKSFTQTKKMLIVR